MNEYVCLPISNAVHITCESAIQCIVAVVIEKASNGIPSIPCSLIACVSTGDQYLIVLHVICWVWMIDIPRIEI